MASEFTLNAALAYLDSELTSLGMAIPQDLVKDIGSKKYIWEKVSVATAEQAIALGPVTTLGIAFFINRDPTNYIELRVATAGTKFAKLAAVNGFWLGQFGSGITAPYAIANSAPCQMEYMIFNT